MDSKDVMDCGLQVQTVAADQMTGGGGTDGSVEPQDGAGGPSGSGASGFVEPLDDVGGPSGSEASGSVDPLDDVGGPSGSEASGPAASEPESRRAPAAPDPVRTRCAELLLSALCPEALDQNRVARLAADIEQQVHELHAQNRLRYKTCVRSKVSNLRTAPHLRQGLLEGSLPPRVFARMSAEEMAGPELRRLREEYSSQGVRERQLPRGLEGTRTQEVRCRRCGGRDCSLTQVTRGALFLPAWVRRGGPDEEAMTFLTCRGCGQQWYHSGWTCL
ncbi:transcription elongation factor A N-terminal and central domain-containing protein [Nematolebias whitei]|uniref:transcription elongation factor A N-terminal and central domain-containing protein n=1 Tax=Nematolebias whitei TaxID=451745 RepID=UPI001899F0B1|nr:transcription elongation factor A N-terminal and central domain-containing protein [Nematolebias whitei]